MLHKFIVEFFKPENRNLEKLINTLVIILVAAVIIKIVDLALSRWQRKILLKLKTFMPADIASVETKITIIRKIFTAAIYFLALVIFLLQFQSVRHVGAGLLASAGLAGIVLGMAAQSTLANLIAGVSISFSQPVRLNDAVIFKNEFGWIEEISLMHTVIRTWDNRRIMVPNSILANEVIENWTIKDPAILGTVMLYADFSCDMEKIKLWVKEIVENSPFAAKEKLSVVQAVDFTEKSVVLRILVKSDDPAKAWEHRCEVREKLLQRFIKEGLALPQIRISKN